MFSKAFSSSQVFAVCFLSHWTSSIPSAGSWTSCCFSTLIEIQFINNVGLTALAFSALCISLIQHSTACLLVMMRHVNIHLQKKSSIYQMLCLKENWFEKKEALLNAFIGHQWSQWVRANVALWEIESFNWGQFSTSSIKHSLQQRLI